MNGKPFEPELLERLRAMAEAERNDYVAVDALAARWGRTRASLLFKISTFRGARRARSAYAAGLHQDRATAGPVDAGPAVARAAPSAMAFASGQEAGGSVSAGRVDAASSRRSPAALALAVHGPRTVAPAAGPSPPAPVEQAGEAPAAPLSPGVCWARAAMARGVDLAKVLRTGGDRLTHRDRAALRGEVAHA